MFPESRLTDVAMPFPDDADTALYLNARNSYAGEQVASEAGTPPRAAAKHASARAVELREARFDDYRQITALQTRNGLAPRSYSEWSGLWLGNPAFAGRQLPMGWVLESASGEIGGYLGNLPLDYQFRGRLVRAATDYSWVVDPAFRRKSVELLWRFLKQPEVELFVCATPNSTAERVLRAFEFARASSGQWDQTGFWITNYPGFAASALRSASIPMASWLAYPASMALFAGRVFQRSHPRPSKDAFEVCDAFDSRFDRFWEELRDERPGHLLADRSRNALEWHFRRSLSQGRAWILAASQGKRLVAYAVLDRRDHPAIGLTRLRIADFQALHGFEELLSPALDAALTMGRKHRIHMLENAGCWLDRFRVSGTAAQYHRRLQCWQFYYKTRDRELSRQLQDPNVWWPSSFDGDASL
jgi:hypothetical protein